MSRVSLLRHGATTAGTGYFGSTDVALSGAGWRQLWAAVDGRRWDRVVSSPLRRCADFARALAERDGIPLFIDARWRELHFGDWEARTAAEIAACSPAALQRFWADPSTFPPPNGESLEALRRRVLGAWRALEDDGSAQSVLVVTHGGPMRIVFAEDSGISPRRLFEIGVAHAQLVEVAMAETCGRC